MHYQTIKLMLAAISLCASQIIMEPVSAKESFDSAEIKNLRFLSRSILKSRVQEKNRIEKEIEPLKAKLQAMQADLSKLDAQITKEFLSVELTTTTLTPQAVLNGRPAQADRSGTPASNRNASLGARKRNIRNTRVKLKSKRAMLENELPSFWEIWKSKTANDKRKELIIEKLKDVESELARMATSGKLNIQDVKQIKRKIELRRPEISFDKIDPTFQTRTKHRNQ